MGIFDLLNVDSYDDDLRLVLGENYNENNAGGSSAVGSKQRKSKKGLSMSNADIFSCFVCGCYYVLKDIDELDFEKTASNSSDSDNA